MTVDTSWRSLTVDTPAVAAVSDRRHSRCSGGLRPSTPLYSMLRHAEAEIGGGISATRGSVTEMRLSHPFRTSKYGRTRLHSSLAYKSPITFNESQRNLKEK